MFNIGAGEMILIALVLLIAVGPEQLPGVIRRTGKVVGQLKTMSDNLRRDFNASLDEIERAADVKSWAGSELDSTVESVKEITTEPFKTDLGVDGSTKVTDLWSRPAADDGDAAESDESTSVSDDSADDDDNNGDLIDDTENDGESNLGDSGAGSSGDDADAADEVA